MVARDVSGHAVLIPSAFNQSNHCDLFANSSSEKAEQKKNATDFFFCYHLFFNAGFSNKTS